MADAVDVAIVGGGPAGAALAVHLAEGGLSVAVIERRAAPEWHACGVFSSPLTRRHLANLGFGRDEIARLHRPIAALQLETTHGARCRIEYRHGHACGFDRLALERALLDRARAAGAMVSTGVVVRAVELKERGSAVSRLRVSATVSSDRDAMGSAQELEARVVVGADGAASLVARAARVYRTRRGFDRAGITFHRRDPSPAPEGTPVDGRFVFGQGWYMGLAPVPGGRVNVGIVVPALRRRQPADIAADIIQRVPGSEAGWRTAENLDRIAAQGRLEHHAARAGGPGWLLVGDAIGFIDPLSGEGLRRAFASAELAAEAVSGTLAGTPRATEDYDRRVRRMFQGKDAISWMLQIFLARPELLDYALRRLALRRKLREELSLVLTDQRRASRVVNPAFMARLLAP